MEKRFEKILKLALPYLRKAKRKDYIVHTKGVIRAMELLLKKENGDKNILIPAAILHDIGWYKVPKDLQMSNNKAKKIRGLKLHLKYAVPVIEKILTKVGSDKAQIKKVIKIVLAHKFKNPRRLDKRLLIDADALSDAFKEQFYADCKAYGTIPEVNYNFRKKNKFYTKTAERIFKKELEKRRKEFSKVKK